MRTEPQASSFIRQKFVLKALILLLITVGPAVAQQPFDKNEFAARRSRVLAKIGDSIAIVFANDEHPHAVRYREAPDFFYLTGVEEPGAILILNGKNKQAVLAAPKKPEWKSRSEGPALRDLKDPASMYGLPIVPLEDLYALFNSTSPGAARLYVPLTPPDQLQFGRGEVIMLDAIENALPFGRPSRIKNLISGLHAWQPQLKLVDINPILDELRFVKTPYEVERVRMAGKIGAEGVKEAIKGTKPGMYEYELEAAARFVYIKRGARGDAFTPIVASGPNTVILHYNKNNRKMVAGDVVYMDYGADYDYYTSDVTRTWPVGEKFTPEQEKMYRCIVEARTAIIAAIKPGALVADLQRAAIAVYKKHGFEKEFAEYGNYVGHPIGLSVHDVGQKDWKFVPGVVYNVEPFLSNVAKQIHVRLEDSILVTPGGNENLTDGVPVEVNEIYALMRQAPISILK